MISIGVNKKRERRSRMERLLTEIYELEQLHKKKSDLKVQHALVLKRDELK